MKLISKLKDFFALKVTSASVATNSDGLLIVENNNSKLLFKWQTVKEIFVYKHDCFAIDLICIGFRIDEEGTYFEINEKIDGYKQMIAYLELNFQGIDTNWFLKVAFPPFATNTLTIWGDSKIPKLWEKT